MESPMMKLTNLTSLQGGLKHNALSYVYRQLVGLVDVAETCIIVRKLGNETYIIEVEEGLIGSYCFDCDEDLKLYLKPTN